MFLLTANMIEPTPRGTDDRIFHKPRAIESVAPMDAVSRIYGSYVRLLFARLISVSRGGGRGRYFTS